MKIIGTVLVVAQFLLLTGCGRSQSNSKGTADAGISRQPFSLSVGIYRDGSPFFDWNGVLYHYSQQSNGLLTWTEGATLKGDFKRLSDGAEVTIDLRLKLDDERYSVIGTYQASVPLTLTYLGTTEDDNDAITKPYPEGGGEIKYEGEAPYTYKKQR